MNRWVLENLLQKINQDADRFIKDMQPRSSDDFFALARALDKKGHQKESDRLLKCALQKDLSHFPSLYTLAFHAFQKGSEREAKIWFRRALRFDPDTETNALYFQKELRYHKNSSAIGIWCLKELEQVHRSTIKTKFQLAKALFEQSQFQEAVVYLKDVLKDSQLAQEATEYLSYIYEHLYQGETLILKNLELASEIQNRTDLFFNLAMVCQHDQKRLDLAMHFFYLSSREDPSDPALRYSLEQAALDHISQCQKERNGDDLTLMLAHIYQGSLGVAQKYAERLPHLHYPQSFEEFSPQKLWKEWLLRDEGPLGQLLQTWFGEKKTKVYRIRK